MLQLTGDPRRGQVHVLGSFIDDALSLDEYKALDADFMNPRTAFIVTPFFCGGDLQDMIKKGRDIPESTVLSILTQVIDAVGKLQRHNRAHRDLKPGLYGQSPSIAAAPGI
jgi:serine/threonine protein kinase|eukprot:COSAG02_NODE_4429_length_5371_cov_4.794196_2_plen_111_part_00